MAVLVGAAFIAEASTMDSGWPNVQERFGAAMAGILVIVGGLVLFAFLRTFEFISALALL